MVVELDPRLLEILACPSPDHAPLRVGTDGDPEADVLTCTSCGRRYPVVDGVPVLLLDEAQVPADAAQPTDRGASGPGGGPSDGSSGEK
jgi:uncharacterized protein YbaR (Trm112 family)